MSIVNFISSWLKDIVVLFILISIAGLIMPKGNMKKYIDLVIGLLIIFTIISPFAKLIKMDFNLSEAVFNYSRPGDNLNISSEEFYIEQEKQIESVYKDKIKSELIKLIEDQSTYKVVDISIELLDSTDKYGEVEYLKLMVTEDDINKNNISIRKVELVDIKGEQKKVQIDDANKYKDLKEIIETKYSISKNKINITEYEKGKGGLQ